MDEMKFEYKMTVIVPIYNGEKDLNVCLESLLMQTMALEDFEVLMINDGSTDQSESICKQYAEIYSNFKLFSKENEGLSATRNFALKRAKGKFICYLDADDQLSRETLKNLYDFFEAHYDEIDEVTYPIVLYKDGKKLPLHYRYKYLTKTGIYDLNKYPFITQTTINICVKNCFDNNIYFDTTEGFRHEDQKYSSMILKDKLKIGFVKEAEYKYNRNNENSIVKTYMYPNYIFETTMEYFEDLFSQFENEVPKYYQVMYIHDLQWKVRSNILYPYHYDKAEFENAVDRIKNLLKKVDVDVIMNHPDIDKFHKYYWIKMKPNSDTAFFGETNMGVLVSKGNEIYNRNKIELILYRLHIQNGNLKILLCAKSPIFSFVEKPKIYANITIDSENYKIEMEPLPSSYNYYHCKTETNNFWFFYYDKEIIDNEEIRFEIEIDGLKYETNYYFMSSSPFDESLSLYDYTNENALIQFKSNVFYTHIIQESYKNEIYNKQSLNIKQKNQEKYFFRKRILEYKKDKPIWLYYDCKNVEYDNAYLQFVHDFGIDDGVDRYYILANSFEHSKYLFNEQQKEHVIRFGSDLHKILYSHADKIITAFIEDVNVIPFSPSDIKFYKDLFGFEIIYLQHGILHASLPWKYTPERVNVDRVVISSYFEKDNFVKKYNFREKDLILSGMPRYEEIDINVKPQNRILFAPTWRTYLIGSDSQGEWIPNRQKFMESEYYLKIENFLNSDYLNSLLEKNNMFLDFKLHPIFLEYKDCFTISNDRVRIADNSVDDSIYAIFITDFSSFVFDFAYLKRPIIYFVPDMLSFKVGLNSYRELDLPFEDAFGELAVTEDEAVEAIEKIIDNGLNPASPYKERMDNFYLPLDNCKDKIYQSIIREDMV